MKRFAALFLALLTAFSLTACGGSRNSPSAPPASSDGGSSGSTDSPAEPVIMKYATSQADDSMYGQCAYRFEELVEEYSGGTIDVQVFNNGQLGSERDIIEQVGFGTIEAGIAASGNAVTFVPDLQIFAMPYLITDLEKAYELLDGDTGRQLLEQFEAIGMYSYHFYVNGWRQFTNAKFALEHPADVKGLKMRCMENDAYIAIYQALGATPSAMSIADFQTAARQGTVDGHDNALVNIYSQKTYEVQPYITLANFTWDPSCFVINKDFMDSLTPEQQEAVKKAEWEVCQWDRTQTATYDEEIIADMKTKGVTFVENVDIAEWQAATASVYDQFADQLPQDVLEAFRAIQ